MMFLTKIMRLLGRNIVASTPGAGPVESELDRQRHLLREKLAALALTETRNALSTATSKLDYLQSRGVPFYRPPEQQQQQSRPSYQLVPAYKTDAATGYPFVPTLEKISFEQDPLFGWPVGELGFTGFDLLGGAFGLSSFPREMYPDRPTSLRTQIAMDAMRFESRAWYEILPQYSGPVGHLVNYTIGDGMTIDVTIKEKQESFEQEEPATEEVKEGSDESGIKPPSREELLAADVKKYLDEFANYKENRLLERCEESALNLFRDGEDALRLWPMKGGDEYPQVRSVDTSTIRGPHNEITGPWSFGVLTSWPRDYEDVQAYNVWYSDNTQEVVSPTQMHLCKLWTVGANVKRGVPLSYKLRKQLPQMIKLLDCMMVGEAARQAIPYIEQYATADRSAVRQATPSALEAYDALFSDCDSMEVQPGTIPRTNKGLEIKDTPQGRAESGALAYRTACESIATACQVPLWFVTGSADSENYASSLVSESPVVKTITRAQRKITDHYTFICSAAIEMAIARGMFPVDTLDVLELKCELPSAVVRDLHKAVDTDIKLLDKKILSPQHLATRNNLDFEEETELIQQAEAEGWENQADVMAGEQLPGQADGAPSIPGGEK